MMRKNTKQPYELKTAHQTLHELFEQKNKEHVELRPYKVTLNQNGIGIYYIK